MTMTTQNFWPQRKKHRPLNWLLFMCQALFQIVQKLPQKSKKETSVVHIIIIIPYIMNKVADAQRG